MVSSSPADLEPADLEPADLEMDTEEDASDGADRRSGSAPSPPRAVPSLLVAAAAIVAAAVFVLAAVAPEAHKPVTYRFTIPLGTARQLASGADVSLFPERLVIDKGDIIELVNHDDRNDEVGPFFVPAFGELRQSVNQAGTFSGTCTLHRSGRVVIVVR